MRFAWLIAGHMALALGVIGIFMPLLPTTPFVLLASFCYARGSERFDAWLLNHPRLGPMIKDWRRDGVIRPRAKIAATLAIAASVAIVVTRSTIPLWAKVSMVITVSIALTYILSRPSRAHTSGIN